MNRLTAVRICIYALICLHFFAAHAQELTEDHRLCFSLQKGSELCGARELFDDPDERDNLISSFKTVSAMMTLPSRLHVSVVRNASMGTVVVWVMTDDGALYAMTTGASFRNALEKLMRAIRAKSKSPPSGLPYGKEKCFGARPELCA